MNKKQTRFARRPVFGPDSHQWFATNVGYPTSRWNLSTVAWRAQGGDAKCKAIMALHAEWWMVQQAARRLTR